MIAAQQTALISVDDYLAGELVSKVKHEYSGGYVYAMAGATNVHNRIAMSWLLAIGRQLRGKPCEPFNSDTKVRIRLPTHTRFYYPDGMVVCEPNSADDTFHDRPVLISEVSSKSTRRIDENEKRDAYLTIPTLANYLVIDASRPRVVVHRRSETGFVAETYEGLDAIIPLPAIDCELSLSELYERVNFAEIEPETDDEL